MKYPLLKISMIFIILPGILVIMQGCKSKIALAATTIKVMPENVSRIKADSLIYLELLKVYPAQKDCYGSEKFANLYLCKKIDDNDSVYVMEECVKVSPLAFDTIHNYEGVISGKYSIKNIPSVVTVFIPDNFKLSNKTKIFFARMGYLTEY